MGARLKSSIDFLKWLNADDQQAFVASHFPLPRLFETKSSDNVPLLQRPWLWMATSGTTSLSTAPVRWIAHTRDSLNTSARAVCDWFEVKSFDRWGRVLTRTHMGGLSLDVRASVSNCAVIDGPPEWEPYLFVDWLWREKISLVSLVPTQIFDLCKNNLKSPDTLRAVIVGGDRLDPALSKKAKELGWALLSTYGLTETASMICSEVFQGQSDACKMVPLPHVQLQTNEQGLLQIQSKSLFCADLISADLINTGRANNDEAYLLRKRPTGWWTSSDRAQIIEGQILIEGRSDDFIKIYGESVYLPTLDRQFAEFLTAHGILAEGIFVAVPDARAGHLLEICLTTPASLELRDLWNQSAPGIARVTKIRQVERISRTALGKLKRSLLAE
jgi:O-succinylbenzoic acid--CoA ligase